MQRIVRDYSAKLHTNKLNNLEEMAKFLEIYNIPRLSLEEIKNVNNQLLVKGLTQ